MGPHPSSYEQRGLVYVKLGDNASARNDWSEVLRLDPKRSFPLANLGYMSLEAGDLREAVSLLTRAINIEPTLATAYQNRARAYMELQDRERAFADLRTARDLIEKGQDTSSTTKMD